MPLYRLVNALGTEIRRFEAVDDVEAGACGRRIAREIFGTHAHAVGNGRTDLGVERHDGDRWTWFAGWMPRSPA